MLKVNDLRDSASCYSLDGRDLEETHLFSLKTLLPRNPGIRELLMCSNTAREIVAAGTGAFISGVLSESLHKCPVLLFHSPFLSEEAAIRLPGSRPAVFLDPTEVAAFAHTYIGWLSGPSPLCIEEYHLSDVLADGCNFGFVIIAAISGDTISIGAFSPAGHFMQTIDEADTNRLIRRKAEPWVRGALDDDINFGGSERRCIGPGGERALVMRVARVNENASLVPTREVVAWNVCEDSDDPGTAQSEVWKWLETPGRDGCPVVAFSRGNEIRSVIPIPCRSFPVLAVYLPITMHEEAEAIAAGILSSHNLISNDLMNSAAFLTLRGRAHELELKITPILDELLLDVGDARELILAVRCGQTVWIRYYPADQQWSEQIGLTQCVADNYKPYSMFTAEEIAAAAAQAVDREEAPYNARLHDDSSLLMSHEPFANDAAPRCRFGIDGHKLWSLIISRVGPCCMGRDVSV